MSPDRSDDLGLFHTGEQPPVDPRRRRATGSSRDDRRGSRDWESAQETTGSVNVDKLRAALADGAHDAPAQPKSIDPAVQRRTDRAAKLRAQARRRRRRRNSVLLALVVLLVIAGGVAFGIWKWQDSKTETVKDFGGTGTTEVFVRIRTGDGLNDIARTLTEAQIVASPEAFTHAASGDSGIAAIRPGYYRLRQQSSAESAVDQLLDPASKTPSARLIPGVRLADVSAVSKAGTKTTPGYLSVIAAAACQPLNGQKKCVTAAELAQVAAILPAQQLGVVDWAIDAVDAAPDKSKRLEGMILPGDYEVPPARSAEETLTAVVKASAERWNASQISPAAERAGLKPYELAIVASIVQAEGIDAEMPQVARVVFNRLAIKKDLEMDSTVNYALDRAQISTSRQDRQNPSPYNTYRHNGLPPTPIGAPSPTALAATYDPAPGQWLFFVKVDPKTGASCFSVTEQEHEECVAQARANGVFDE